MIFIKLEKKGINCQKIHPLLMTRGVPGTHDINLILRFLRIIKNKFLDL